MLLAFGFKLVLSLIFVVAIGNFALGFAAHSLWRQSGDVAWPAPPAWRWSWPRNWKWKWRLRFAWPRGRKDEAAEHAGEASGPAARSGENAAAELCESAIETQQQPPPEPIVFEEVAQTYLHKLGNEVAGSQSFVEAAVETFRLGVGVYRHDLLGIEEHLRDAIARGDEAVFDQTLAALEGINAAWLARQTGAADMLRDRRGVLGKFEFTGEVLHGLLDEQSSKLKAVQASLATIDRRSDLAAGCPQSIGALCRSFALTHALRDGMQDSLAQVLRSEKRLGDVERRLHFDRDTTLYTRLGLEVLMSDWRRDDPSGSRLASLALIDLDGCGLLNQRFGVRTVDRMLDAFAGQLATMIRRDRGFDRMARLGGQQFVAFLGDTGPRQAMSAAERIRQTIQAMTIEVIPEAQVDWRVVDPAAETKPMAELEMTATMAVVEIDKRDDLTVLLASLRAGLALAKEAGRNRTFLDEGQGFIAIEPPVYQVKGKIVSVPAVGLASQ